MMDSDHAVPPSVPMSNDSMEGIIPSPVVPPVGPPPMPVMMPPVGGLPMPPIPIPGMMPPFLPPGMFPNVPVMPMKKKWRQMEAPKEFPKEGEGFPFPQGGWAYGVSIGKPYDYMKMDEYSEKIKQAEKRITMQLAYIYLCDMNPKVEQFVGGLKGEEILVIHGNDEIDISDSIIHHILSSNNIPHQSIKISQLESQALKAEKHLIILADTLAVTTLPQPSIQVLTDFTQAGGNIISFNNGISVLVLAFPQTFTQKIGTTTLDKQLVIETHLDAQDSQIFQKYAEEASSNRQLVRLHGLQRFGVVAGNNSVQNLIVETAPQAGQLLGVKFSPTREGVVYHLLTTHLVSKVGSQGGTSFQPLPDMLPSASKALASKCIEDLSKLPNPPTATITAWKAALSCGYPVCINIAQSYYQMFDSFFSLLMVLSKK